jgi:hypothetical protein
LRGPGCQTTRKNCRAAPDEIALARLKTLPTTMFVETGDHADKSGGLRMRGQIGSSAQVGSGNHKTAYQQKVRQRFTAIRAFSI